MYERTKQLPDIDNIKPASNLADYKSLAALASLRACEANNFRYLGACWVTRLMNAKAIFFEKSTARYLLSFGVFGDAGLLWEVSPFGEENNFFCLKIPEDEPSVGDAKGHLQFVCTGVVWYPQKETNDEEYQGVPTEVCSFPGFIPFAEFITDIFLFV